MEKAGHQVRPGEGYQKPTRFIIDGEEIRFKIRERLVRPTSPPTPEAAKFAFFRGQLLRPSGELRFTIEFDSPYTSSRQWRDSSSRRLEAQVNIIFRSILETAPLEQERWAETLRQQALQWREAHILSQFVQAVRVEIVKAVWRARTW